MKKSAERRSEIIDHLEVMRPERHSYDTLQFARYIETGQIDDGPDTEAAPEIDPSEIQFLPGAKVFGPFKLDPDRNGFKFAGDQDGTEDKPKDEQPGRIWCDNCKEWHQLPDDALVADAVKEFFKQFAPKEATDPDASPATKIPGRDA